MESLIEFVKEWGYIAVFFGAVIEGETIILTASFLAYLGYFSLPKLMAVAFVGTLTADQALYYVGRYYGPSLIKRFPKWRFAADKAFVLLHKWDTWFILSFRFIYGIRAISPIVIGTSGLPARRFIPLNFIAAIVWTTVSCLGGYLLGGTIETIIENFHLIQNYFIGGIAVLIGLILVIWWFRRQRSSDKKTESHPENKDGTY